MIQSSSYFSFPSDDIDPKLKRQKQYCIDFCKAIHSAYTNNQSYVNKNSQDRVRALRAYGNGKQDIRKYVTTLLGIDESKNQGVSTDELIRKGFMNVNWEIISVAPKFKLMLMQLFEEIEHDVYANATDPLSVNTKEAAMFNMWAKKQLRQELDEINALIGITEDDEPYVPESLEEMDLLNQSGFFKLSTEQAIETAIKYTHSLSRWHEIKRRLIEDLYELHFAVVRTYFDKSINKYKTRYVDVENFVCSHSPGNDMEEIWYAGEYRLENIATVRKKLGDDITEAEIKTIAQNVMGKHDLNPGANLEFSKYDIFDPNTQTWGYDRFKVLVFDGEIRTVDSEYIQKRTDSRGVDRYYDENFGKVKNSDRRKTIINKVEMWYKGTWLVDSNYCYDFGPATDIVRKQEHKADSSYKMYRIPGKSKLEMIIPNIDNIQLAYLKLQNAMVQAQPQGVAIEVSSLMNVTMGTEKLKPLEIIKIRRQEGTLLYKATAQRSFTPSGTQAKPIMELKGGIGEQLQEFMTIVDSDLNQIRDLTGFTQPFDASQQPKSQGLGVSEMLYTSATKALGFIYTAYIDIKERSAEDIWHKISNRISVSSEAYQVYEQGIGGANTRLLLIDKKLIGDTKCNIYIRARANKEQIQTIMNAATESMKASKNGYGGISTSDLVMLQRILDSGNIKLAEMMLAKKERDAELRRLKEAAQNQRAQEQATQILEAQKHREKIEALEAEKAKETAVIEAKKQADLELENVKHKNKLEEIKLTKELETDLKILELSKPSKTQENNNK